MFDYTQAQAGFEQEIKEVVHTVKMNRTTYAIANAILSDGIFNGREDVVLADSGVKVRSKLHQIYSGTVIGEEQVHIFDMTKAHYIDRTFVGRKIAIFTKFQAEAEMLARVFTHWTNSPEVFNADPTQTYIGQIQSSREGVNLSSADFLIYLTPDFSALSYLQGRDRATYKGRPTPPEVHWIFAEGGIEAEIYARVIRKEDYTIKHFKHDRSRLSEQANAALQGPRMARIKAHKGERGGIPRPTTDTPEQTDRVRGGQVSIW